MTTSYNNFSESIRKDRSGIVTTNQGGEAYSITEFSQLKRFLIIGSDKPTFYADSQKLTIENAKAVQEAWATDPIATVQLIESVSDEGIAPSNDPALFALALGASFVGDNQLKVRELALAALPKVARTGTHLFHFVSYVDAMRGWGRGLQNAISRWYLDRSPMSLAKQVTKYGSRDGWSHRDVLRLAHTKPTNEDFNLVLHYATQGNLIPSESQVGAYLNAIETVKGETDISKIVKLVADFNLPREVLPTQALNSPLVWEALLHGGNGMPIGALLRNMGNLGKHGLLDPGTANASFVSDRIVNFDVLKEGRIHPMDLLKAKLVYQSGRGMKGKGEWNVNRRITDSLEEGFYASFGTIKKTGKYGLLALDVSGSMTFMGDIGGVPGLTPRVAAAVMAMVTAKLEDDYEIFGFCDRFMPLDISKHDSLNSVISKTTTLSFGGTDCSLPFKYAEKNRKSFDYFIVYTDNETGGRNPADSLRSYRKTMNKPEARSAVMAFASNNFSIADPRDRNSMDFVGLSADSPRVLSEFITNGL